MTPGGSPGRGILGYRMPISGPKEMWSSTEARWGARWVHLGLEGHVPKAALAGAEMEQSCLCSGPTAPREERVCPGVLREGLGWAPAKGAGTRSAFLQIGHNDSNPNPTYLI